MLKRFQHFHWDKYFSDKKHDQSIINKRKLRINSSLKMVFKIIKISVNSGENLKFRLFTNHIEKVKEYLNQFLGNGYEKYVSIEKYHINSFGKFLTTIDKL